MNYKFDRQSLKTYFRLLKSVRPYSFIFSMGILATILESLTDAGFVWLIKPIIDKGFIARDLNFIHLLPFLIVGIFITKGIFSFISSYYVNKVGRRVITDYRQQIFKQLLHLPASYFDRQTSGKLLSLIIYNVDQVAEATTFAMLTVMQEGFLVVGFLFVMFSNSFLLSTLFLIATPIIAFIIRFTSKRLQMLSSNVQKAMGDVTHVAEESIEGYKVIRMFGGEKYEEEKFHRATELNQHREMKIIVTDTVGTSAVQILATIPIAFILFLATLPSLHISAGSFAAILGAMVSLLRPLRRLTRVNTMIQKGLAGAKSIFGLLDEPLEQDTGQLPIYRARGHIIYRNVSFQYPRREQLVLNKLTFEINPGETIALVGKSGSGKSTLVNLLPRFYDTTQGEIFLDGTGLQYYKLSDLRNQFAFVSQHISLFNDSIARNIAYGRYSETEMDEIKRVARAADAYDFIQALPNGFDTIVGENGVLLSGGQRQRIAIARALLKNAPILIFDEATSSLDTETERYVQSALEQLMQSRTTLIIAHRLSTVEKADRILVLDEGNIVEMGTHQELLNQKGYYAKLYYMQFQDAVPMSNTESIH